MQTGEPQPGESTPQDVSPQPKADLQPTSADQRSNQIAFGGAVTTPAREITSHRRKRGQEGEPNDLDDVLKVEALDEAGAGGAHHHYRISRLVTVEAVSEQNKGFFPPVDIKFQNGAVQDVGVNGISNESLLAIVRDRLEGFQVAGEFACHDNQNAIDGIDVALKALHRRTKDRIARKVEGTSKQ